MTPETTPEETPVEQEAPAEEPTVQQATPAGAGGSGTWIAIAVVLGLALGVLGWQVVTLKRQVASLKGQMRTSEQAMLATQNGATAIATRLKPLTRKSAEAALNYSEAGDAEEAEVCLEQAKELLSAVETLDTGETPELRKVVADADIALGGDGDIVAASAVPVDSVPMMGGG